MPLRTPLYDATEVAERFRLSERTLLALRAEVGAGFKAGKQWLFETQDIQAITMHLRRKTLESEAEDDPTLEPEKRQGSGSTRPERTRPARTRASEGPILGPASIEALALAESRLRNEKPKPKRKRRAKQT